VAALTVARAQANSIAWPRASPNRPSLVDEAYGEPLPMNVNQAQALGGRPAGSLYVNATRRPPSHPPTRSLGVPVSLRISTTGTRKSPRGDHRIPRRRWQSMAGDIPTLFFAWRGVGLANTPGGHVEQGAH